jgi:hypothetical protein
MPAFPSQPVSPRVFIEEILPSFFADLVLSDAERGLALKLGVVLRGEVDGEEGGEWTLRFSGGELEVVAGRVDDCDVTIVQAVEDWRSAFWEGRPGLVADLVETAIKQGSEALMDRSTATSIRRDAAIQPTALKGLSDLRGLVEAVIAGAEAEPDWRLGILIGPGPIPEAAHATIRLGAEQAEAIRRGDLHPVEALITGQLRLEGDLGLILQLQAVAMTATAPAIDQAAKPVADPASKPTR